MKELRIATIITSILTILLWLGFIFTNHVHILTALVGNFLQVIILIKIIMNYKKDKEITENSCETCRFHDNIYCNVGTHYAKQGLKKICYRGELWEKK